jgi:hypothetical protein
VEDPVATVFWNEVRARSRKAAGKKLGGLGFGTGFGQM